MNFAELYTVVDSNTQEVTIKLSDENHAIFKAHFPSNPILPAFCHFEIVSNVFQIEIENIKKAKFTSVVLPNQILVYKKDGNKFRVLCEEKEVAGFSL